MRPVGTSSASVWRDLTAALSASSASPPKKWWQFWKSSKQDGWIPGVSADFLDKIQNAEDADLAIKVLRVHSIATDNATRKQYGRQILRITAIWLVLVLATVWLAAANVQLGSVHLTWVNLDMHFGPFNLSDATLIALITTTTANVIGVMLVVATYLFPASKTQDGKDKK